MLRSTSSILIVLVTINGCDCGAISLFNLTNDPPPWCMLCCVLVVHLVKSPYHKTGWQDGAARGLEITVLLFHLNFLVIFSVGVQERFDGKAKAIVP